MILKELKSKFSTSVQFVWFLVEEELLLSNEAVVSVGCGEKDELGLKGRGDLLMRFGLKEPDVLDQLRWFVWFGP